MSLQGTRTMTRKDRCVRVCKVLCTSITFLPSQLSGRALEALADFYSERDSEKQRLEQLRIAAERQGGDTKLSMGAFTEDWNASQFWVWNSQLPGHGPSRC